MGSMELGEKIQISRKKKGMSQVDLANVLNVSRQAVQKWESGVSNPELNKVIELGRVLDVSLDWLLGEKAESQKDLVAEEEPIEEQPLSVGEEIKPAQEDNKEETRRERPTLDKPKNSFKKILLIGSIALLLVGGGVATAVIVGINANKDPLNPGSKLFEKGAQSIVVEGYEKTEVINGVSYAFGNIDGLKSMYIVDIDTDMPSFLSKYEDYDLEGMLYGAFNSRRDYVFVSLPDWSVFERINSSTLSFKGCTKLENVQLPEGLLSIGDFGDCTSLSEIALPDTLTEINPDAFRGCRALKEIALPDSLKSLGKYAFMNCTSLEEVNFDGTTRQWASITKGSMVWDNTPVSVVHCSNGDVPLDK